jgi:hypothetical protein
VNHALQGSRIEFFEHKKGSLKARLTDTFQDSKLLPNPNDVLMIDRKRFYATNSVKYSSGLMHLVEKFLAQPWGHIVYRDEKARVR